MALARAGIAMGFWDHKCGESNHRFEPRYDRIPPEQIQTSALIFNEEEFIQAQIKRVYICDVCVRCGKVTGAREAK